MNGQARLKNRTRSLPTLRLTPEEFAALPDYSVCLPLDLPKGKRWRCLDGKYRSHWPENAAGRRGDFRWIVCEYVRRDRRGSFELAVFRPLITLRSSPT